MASQTLNDRINKYAEKLHYEKRGHSFVSGAEYYKYKKVAHSGDIEKKDFVKSLKIELQKFGKIGDKFNKSSIGFCAETVSANRVLKKYPKNISDIKVGIAIRPKTLQTGKKCKICKTIF
jgi:hypothetical protein